MKGVHWERTFREIGALFEHDGNPKRPYALLATPSADGRRRMTNRYFNSARVQERPKLFGKACEDLAALGKPYVFGGPYSKLYAVGAAEGGIALSQRIGEALHMRSAYAAKRDGGLVFERFQPECPAGFLLVEDTVTTGRTLEELQDAACASCGGQCCFAPQILALCKRMGPYKLLTDRRIITLIDLEVAEWGEGENPFTPGGREFVEPVPAKTRWRELMRAYD